MGLFGGGCRTTLSLSLLYCAPAEAKIDMGIHTLVVRHQCPTANWASLSSFSMDDIGRGCPLSLPHITLTSLSP